jgi:NAD(P)H-flavin reductase
VLYSSELEAWGRQDGVQVLVTVDHGEPSWRGNIGLVTMLFSEFDLVPGRTIGLVCGPEVMMRFAIQEFNKRSVGDDRLYISMERNMHCAVGFCGHCQFGPEFICLDGPVFRFDRIRRFFDLHEA